jgi:peroxiredoxin
MTKLSVGQLAPDFELQTLDGRFLKLSDFWGNGRSALLIFLRHLA